MPIPKHQPLRTSAGNFRHFSQRLSRELQSPNIILSHPFTCSVIKTGGKGKYVGQDGLLSICFRKTGVTYLRGKSTLKVGGGECGKGRGKACCPMIGLRGNLVFANSLNLIVKLRDSAGSASGLIEQKEGTRKEECQRERIREIKMLSKNVFFVEWCKQAKSTE